MDKKIYEVLRRSLTNIAQNYIDEYVEQNAEFRAKAGLKAKIIRSTNGTCCKWCDRLAGVYNYPAPREVYQRHDNCDCTVTYVSEKGARDVHTKQQLHTEEARRRIEALEEIKKTAADGETIRRWVQEHKRPKEKIQFEEGYNKTRHKKEIECAKWMSEMFGGKITCLNEVEVHKMPDFLWNGKAWEEKTASSLSAIDRNVRKACHQICSMEGVDPGGIIVTLTCEDNVVAKYAEIAEHRFRRETFVEDASLILKRGSKILKIIEK